MCAIIKKKGGKKNATFSAIKAFATCGIENVPVVARLHCRDRLFQPHLPSTGNGRRGMHTPHLSEVCHEDTPLPNPSQPPCWGNSSLSRHANCLHYPTPVVWLCRTASKAWLQTLCAPFIASFWSLWQTALPCNEVNINTGASDTLGWSYLLLDRR